jgi:hypothetical protein
MTEQLGANIVILEEEPKVPAVAALPSAVLLCIGVCERGPISDAQLTTSEDEYEKKFGGFTADAECAIAARGFFGNGGNFAWFVRTLHYTDLSDPAAHTGAKGQVNLQNSGSAATPALVTSTEAQSFNLRFESLLTLDITTDLGGPTTCTLLATAATITAGAAETYNLSGTETLIFKVDQGPAQTVTFQAGDISTPGAATAAELAARLNLDGVGIVADDNGGSLRITSDKKGTGSYIQVTGGTANTVLTFGTTEIQGTGNVANLAAVTGAEIEAVVEAAIADVEVTVNGNGTLTFQTAATGSTKTIQIVNTSGLDTALGLDNNTHTGTDASPVNTLQVDGKYFGAYTDGITIGIENAPSTEATEFTLKVYKGGVLKETFPNVTMDDTAANYVETVVNNVNYGSQLIAVTDLDVGPSPATERPANGTSSAMAGGDDGLTGIADADYLGNQSGPTGLYCFDRVSSGRILIVPGVATAAVHKGMMDYAETHRNGSMFCVLDCPAGQTKEQIVSYVNSNGILNYSEFGAIYWPRIKVSNPSTTVFGDSNEITIAPIGWIAGLYANNDKQTGGVYESPAGVGIGHAYGVIRGMLGVEDDPGGNSQHEVLDQVTRDYVYPNRINPISKDETYPWAIDGGRTLKSSGNFPNIGERRGVIFIEQSIKTALVVFKHRFNNRENRRRANRMIKAFLLREMGKGAFRSNKPSEAFYIDTSDALNPLINVFAGIMTIRIGLATNKPNEFIYVLVTQDTRALQEELAAA